MNYDVALGHLVNHLLYEAQRNGNKLRFGSFDRTKTSHQVLLRAAEIAKLANPRIEISLGVGFIPRLFSKQLRKYKREKNKLVPTAYEILATVRKKNDYPYTIWEDIYESFYRN